ncbi:hypothetical protein [Myxococcus sp. AB025B]|uniref:hypothetical protein n=1 Tax=Myxococcus sp. AB025B TaxID=2562794 RepID=UPI001142DB29|nr:hypothetical protein [Myxococcus sp. AB025B]
MPTDDLKVFASPRLRGKRFDNNPDPNNVTIPVEVLPMLDDYRQAILETARALYWTRTGQKKVPAGFDDAFSLRLGRVEDGSVIPNLLRATIVAGSIMHADIVFPANGKDLFEEARDVVGETIQAVAQKRAIPSAFPRKYLGKLRSMGEVLEEGDTLELHVPGVPNPPVYHRALKDDFRDLAVVLSTGIHTFVGQVTGMDVVIRTFSVRTRDGINISATYGEGVGSEQEVVDLLRNRRFMRAEVVVDATFDGEGKLRQVDRLLKLTVTTALDGATVKQLDDRFGMLASVEPGWLDGNGSALPAAELPWAKDFFFELMVEGGIPKPRLYPTPAGDIEAEWSYEAWEVSATVMLKEHVASVTAVNVDTNAEGDGDFDLNSDDGRAEFVDFLHRYLTPRGEVA